MLKNKNILIVYECFSGGLPSRKHIQNIQTINTQDKEFVSSRIPTVNIQDFQTRYQKFDFHTF